MLPRALLFSPDDATNALMQEVLSSLACEVDSCSDIFAAIERLTNFSFKVIVVDWREELEASFLLKTARELKANRDAFTLAVLAPHQLLPADAHVSASITKPFTVEDATAALFSMAEPAPQKPVQTTVFPKLDKPGVADFLQQAAAPPIAPPLLTAGSRQNLAHLFLSEPTRPLPRPVSRIASVASLLWPVIIVASLVLFDQWPNLRHGQLHSRSLAAVSGAATRLEHRLNDGASTGVAADRPFPASASSDLLADYAQPAPPLQPETLISQSPAVPAADLPSLQALPGSFRVPHLAATDWIQRTAAYPEIPSSLRFPPSFAAIPGQRKSADTDPNIITLPEFAARALLEKEVRPNYPQMASRNLDTAVVLLALVADDGTIRDLKLIRGQFVLARAALDAVKQWRFRPYQRNGKNVDIQTFITIDFKRPS